MAEKKKANTKKTATKTTKKSCNCKSNTNNNNTTTNNSYGNNGYICKPMYGFHPGYGCPQPYCPELDCYQKLCMAKQQLAAAENNFDEAVEVIENIYDFIGIDDKETSSILIEGNVMSGTAQYNKDISTINE